MAGSSFGLAGSRFALAGSAIGLSGSRSELADVVVGHAALRAALSSGKSEPAGSWFVPAMFASRLFADASALSGDRDVMIGGRKRLTVRGTRQSACACGASEFMSAWPITSGPISLSKL